MATETKPRLTAEQLADLGSKLTPGVVGLYGPPGTLKSTIAAGWIGPVDFKDLEYGSSRIWKRGEMLGSGHLRIEEMGFPTRSVTTRHEQLEGYTAAWAEFMLKHRNACADRESRTVVEDTATRVWKLIQDGFLEEKQKEAVASNKPSRKSLLQIEFGEPNSRMDSVFNEPGQHHKWLIMVMHDTDEYAPVLVGGRPVMDPDTGRPLSAPTGKKIPDGYRHTRGLCHWIFRTYLDKDRDGALTPMVEIEKSAAGIDLVGKKWPWFSFNMLVERLDLLGRV